MKQIESKSKRWPGTVTLSDPMTLPQVIAFEKALQDSGEFFEDKDGSRVLKPKMMWGGPDAAYIVGVLACVEKWELEGFPKKVSSDNFPATPRKDSHELVQWLFGEILSVYAGEIDIPNE